ncbi:DUF1194 domain-containing protein [Maribius pontilimi]|uniref:DUF1194 domain-containing protein n=1 Tax=Palleronia pontilimi TaxID=1964209 RepID=A0A934MC84_9RHOB|nr:DUF1194 domain-containing protein [Palleronia pontilimi]MBJ3762240.1 DUF1194 domain-containing protein [Palleronia pontilimi]
MRCLLILFLTLWAPMVPAQTNEVDLELLLLVDVSRSMSPRELEIQRRGYAEALSDPEVIDAILNGLTGRIALSYVEWAGADSIRPVVDWTIIDSAADARAFAGAIDATFRNSMRRTSISGALGYGINTLNENDIDGLRRVIDISGDGPNNHGGDVRIARDRAVAAGIVVNGLPLMTRDGIGTRWHLENLDDYYRACVIGGPGAFVLPVLSWVEFAPAIKRKLILEIAGDTPRLWQAQAILPDAYDCLIGEKIWRRNRVYELP